MSKKMQRLASLLLVVLLVATSPQPSIRAFAETLSLASNQVSVQSTYYPVRFYHIDETGRYVLYSESGFANPQNVSDGELPALPAGFPDEHYGYRFTQWDENATQPVYGSTNVYAQYRPLATVTHTVEFVTDEGASVGESFHAIVKEGEAVQYTVNAPAMEGYRPQEERAEDGFSFAPTSNNGTVTVNIPSATVDRSYRIVYYPNANATYYVDHYTQQVSGGYTFNSTEVMSGPVGSLARPQVKEIEGYELKTDLSDITTRITADGQTRIRLEYDRREYSVYYDAGTQGYFADGQENPVLVRYGDPIPSAPAPTRKGYTFQSWEIPDGATTMPPYDITVKAKWTAGATDYLVVIWGEEANKDPITGNYEYGVIDSYLSQGTSGGTASYTRPSGTPYPRFTYKNYEQGVKINADGSTVLNVYYTRNSYTIDFYYFTGYLFSMTAKYEENLEYLYQQQPEIENYNFRTSIFKRSDNVRTTLPTTMFGKNESLDKVSSMGTYKSTLNHHLQTLNPDGTPNTNKSAYTHVRSGVFGAEAKGGNNVIGRWRYPGYDYANTSINKNIVTWGSQEEVQVEKTWVTNNESVDDYYYDLRAYKFTFHDRGRLRSVTKYFTADLASLEDMRIQDEAVAGYEGFVFEGWYENQDFSGSPYTFQGRTMPNHDIVLYAKWSPPTQVVTFDTLGGSAVASQTVAKWGYATEPAAPTLSDRTFVGWYRDPAYRNRFLFSQPITADITLYARWSGDDAVPITIRHEDEKGVQLIPDTTETGPLGQSVTVYAEDISGYMPFLRSQDVRLNDIRGVTVVFRYTTMKAITYTVYYKDAADRTTDLLPPKDVQISTSLTSAVVTETREIIPSYTADEAQKTLHLVYPEPNDITFYYTKYNSATTYSVVTHLERQDGEGFETSVPVTKPADLGALVREQPTGLQGYSYDAQLSTATGVVLSGGRLTLNLYYRCLRYSYQVQYINQSTGDVIRRITRSQIKHNQEITETAPELAGLGYVSYEMGTDSGTAPSVTTRITSNGTVIKFYYERLFTITAEAVGGTITPGTTSVRQGESISFSFAPEEGYAFEALLIDGAEVDIGGRNTYVFTDVQQDHTISVRYFKDVTPLTIKAQDQVYIYNDDYQGIVGGGISQGLNTLVTVQGLRPGHTLESITLGGDQERYAGTYTGTLVPSGAKIVEGTKDVTSLYEIDYRPGSLIINKKGNGVGDGNGGELPMQVTALDQVYTYNGLQQGIVGTTPVSEDEPIASAEELVSGHKFYRVTIGGERQTAAGTYTNTLIPSNARIMNGKGEDVSSNYLLTTESYIPGSLIIRKIGEENPVVITAQDQSFIYNGKPQGNIDVNLPVEGTKPVAVATGLETGHRLKSVTIAGTKQTVPGTYPNTLIPSGAIIVDASGTDVTGSYHFGSGSYVNGTLTIHKKGNGIEDGKGGELPMDITATDQTYIYNGQLQGTVGVNLEVNASNLLASAMQLVPDHRLKTITLTGDQQRDVGTYTDTLVPSGATIVDENGVDVTAYYLIEPATSYHAGTLKITQRTEETPIVIRAEDQHYVYDEALHGVVGDVTIAANDAGALIKAEGLLQGHRLASAHLGGSQQREPNVYTDMLVPSGAKIVDGAGNDVTSVYTFGANSYVAGTLTIHKKGNGVDDGKGGEEPMEITAKDQVYVYNGKPQGQFGANLPNTGGALATALELLPNHRLANVTLSGAEQTNAGTYTGAIVPTGVRIVNGQNQDVTSKYLLTDESYYAGSLIINKKGNGVDDGKGGELPMDITAKDQTYVYNGQLQGEFGPNLAITAQNTWAAAVQLVSGHTLASITLTGNQREDVGTYPDALVPSAAKIVDGGGTDVTRNYLIETTSYHPGMLKISPLGEGTPIVIRAEDQHYVYDEGLHGVVGNVIIAENDPDALIKAEGLLQGHRLASAHLGGSQQREPDVYTDMLVPSGAKIVDGAGNDVTSAYTFGANSYVAGTLTIHKKGNGVDDGKGGEEPVEITAKDQVYVYNGQPQGQFGNNLPNTGNVLATALELLPNHRLANVTLSGSEQTNTGSYDGAIVPTGVRIVNGQNQDVTSKYLLTDASYYAGTLIINKKGNGVDDGKGGELPMDITAKDQLYVYNGQLQGEVGQNLAVTTANALAEAIELAPGHRLSTITLTGDQQRDPGTYAGTLVPSAAQIVDAGGANVTRHYLIEDSSYHAGTLKINPLGEGTTVTIRALDQHYIYNESAQGVVGDVTVAENEARPVLKAEGLLQGHRLASAHIGGSQQTEPDVYTDMLVPSGAKIVDGAGADVTSVYTFSADSYVAGTLTIHKKGNGVEDGNGGEEPVEVTAVDQHFIYNGKPQGTIGTDLANNGNVLATAIELLPNHRLATVDIAGTQRTDPNIYTDALIPTGVTIVNGSGVDVTDKYLLTPQSYYAGTLTIHKKGNGIEDGNGGELPMDITAKDQHFVYNGAQQGNIGTGLAAATLAEAVDLLPEHSLKTITIRGDKQTEAGEYPDTLQPDQARIVDGQGRDVTDKYLIVAESYHTGDLIIHKKGNGEDDGNGGELPMEITAMDQHYVYNGKPQGAFGDDLAVEAAKPIAEAIELVQGHSLKSITLAGDQQTIPAEYPGAIKPSGALIVDRLGQDVTKNYLIEDSSYRTGTLTIHKKGNGVDDGKGGELPMEITAADQHFVYNAERQGTFGTNLNNLITPALADALELVPGHRLKTISLAGNQQMEADTYADAIMPDAAVIVDAQGGDVTAHYLIEPGSYRAGDLIIHKKGNGEDDGNGGELPLEITATDQHYVYNGEPQGIVGDLTIDPADPLATAVALVDGHRIDTIHIAGTPRTPAGNYPNTLVPSGAAIVDGNGVDVTHNYLLETGSYYPGDLIIHKKGNGVDDGNHGELPMEITAADQHYVYNGGPQGVIGNGLPVGTTDPLATAFELVPGHVLKTISIVGKRETDANTYEDALHPRDAIIVDAGGTDVTVNYLITGASYIAGDLIIHKKGNGEDDGNNGELPLEITAADQSYVYNGKAQGIFGNELFLTTAQLATAHELVPNDRIQWVTLTGTPQTDAAVYQGAILPTAVKIVNAFGQDVTKNYLIEDGSYRAGTLTIHKKGNGVDDGKGGELPMDITAANQTFDYNDLLQGTYGTGLTVNAQNALARAVALVSGHRLSEITLTGEQKKDVGPYPDIIVPSEAAIVDGQGQDVTRNYLIEDDSYHPGTLTIQPAGSGSSVIIRARDQHYIYNETPQGIVGDITIDASDADPLVYATGLLTGHRLVSATIGGQQEQEPATYPGVLLPSNAVILDGDGTDVTAQYGLTDANYAPGDLIIHKKGNGEDDGKGGELPMEITAADQNYVYNATAQGVFGGDLTITPQTPFASAVELLPGHKLVGIALLGTPRVDPATYTGAIEPLRAVIVDGAGVNVTDKYLITDDSYIAGDLIIHKKGNGEDDGNGGELPMEITAADQHYVYNAKPQGRFGADLTVEAQGSLATAFELVPGHRLASVTLFGMQETVPQTYTGAIQPMQAKIVDELNRDVTEKYLLTTDSYIAGDLIIHKKGNGVDDGNGGEEPLEVTAADQHYVYNGEPQGKVGDDLPNDPTDPLVTIVELVPGHRIEEVSLEGDQQTDPEEYPDALLPTGVKIVDEDGNDVTDHYNIQPGTFRPGDLIIHKKGNGEDDGNGGELPMEITALDQVYVYNGKPQGKVGDDLTVDAQNPLVDALELVKGHRVKTITIAGQQRTNADTYQDELVPRKIVIVDGDGAVVTDKYLIVPGSYIPGDLIIKQKGNGEDDGNGGELPMQITAADQHYVYNDGPQGRFGTNLTVETQDPIATAFELVDGHRLGTVSLTGDQKTIPGTYGGAIMPDGATIVDAQDNDMTANYLLTPDSYIAGSLVIHKKGNGEDDGNGGELPMEITAADQHYVYNGEAQGEFGANLRIDQQAPQATAFELVSGHRLETILLLGTQQTDAGTYPGAITPLRARIVDGEGNNVTDYYLIDDDSYVAGTLTIHKKGNGTDDGKGGEEPMEITATDQHFVYNGKPQGTFGNDLPVDPAKPIATAEELVPGDRIGTIAISGTQQTIPDSYTGALTPGQVTIVNGRGRDVTENYLITSGSYLPGDLIIHKKGNGEDDGKGGELPMDIYALDQRYEYNGQLQGEIGQGLTVDPLAPVASAIQLVPGHSLKTITIGGEQKMAPDTYTDLLVPADAGIVDAGGQDVTDYYLIEAESYHPGTLRIVRQGENDPVTITATDQHYVYNERPQGVVGTVQIDPQDAKPLAVAEGLLQGHRLAEVFIDGSQQQEPATYTDTLIPRDALILDAQGNDVTDHYALEVSNYRPGTLTIHKKGNGGDDGNGGEEPLDVTAVHQHFVYNGAPQGTFGTNLANDPTDPLATAVELLPGHNIKTVTLSGAQETDPATYAGRIVPSAVTIVDGQGNDVTDKYLLETSSYHAGDLIIHKKGNGGDDGNGGEEPMVITAANQVYTYNGQPQGAVGANLTNDPAKPLATALELVDGHRLAEVSILGTQRTESGTYTGALVPVQVKIVDGAGNDVTDKYLIEPGSYVAGDLIIKKKGSGGGEDGGDEEPMIITAANQHFVYNGGPQGTYGTDLEITRTDALATAVELAQGHRLKSVTLTGTQQTDPTTYAGAIKPSGAVIVDALGNEVTKNYEITAASYVAGDLIIHKKGNGNGDGNGGEEPLEISAANQQFTYNGKPQGTFGDNLTVGVQNPLATAVELVQGHRIATVSLAGTQQTEAETYKDAIVPTAVTIVDGRGRNMTDKYLITEDSYLAGDLIIGKKGNGGGEDGGDEEPLEIRAGTQQYIYNGQPQGQFGNNLTVTPENGLATASELVEGHRVDRISLAGSRQTDAATYTDAITPSAVRIVDAQGGDVTGNYLIEEGSYVAGDLVIKKKGNGGGEDGGDEEPLEVTATAQRYIYNGDPQGVFGVDVEIDAAKPLATAQELVQGHRLASVALKGAPRTNPGIYTDAIVPAQAVIVDARGNNVTDNYLLEAGSYIPGTLTIHKKGNGGDDGNGGEEPMVITAMDQTYIYNGEAQGIVGNNLTNDPAKPLVTAVELVPGHSVAKVSISGSRQTAAGDYPDSLRPTSVTIVDGKGQDVTAHYLITAQSYVAGSLTIKPKGNGGDDGNGGEEPLEITAADQTYVFNDQLQGAVGSNLIVQDASPLATAFELVPGHKLSRISIDGEQQREPGTYPYALVPHDAKIVDARGRDVTANYLLEASSYLAGTLTIKPYGEAVALTITASDQHYVYNEQMQGTVGTVAIGAADPKPLAKAEGLLFGHRLARVTIDGSQQREPAEYTDSLVPRDAVIHDASGRDVTGGYTIGTASYVPGTLTIHKKGNGGDDGNGGEEPMDIIASDQRFIYNGQPQGDFGVNLAVSAQNPRAKAVGLLPGHSLSSVTLAGTAQTNAATYPGAIVPLQAHIVDARGQDVTDKYLLVDESYHAGTLTIKPKGNGNGDGDGGEEPVIITASGQSYVYNGQPQGTFGENLPVETTSPLATIDALVPGHKLANITLKGTPRTDPATYPDAIEPAQARILDGAGRDVTDNYLIEAGSYVLGTLTIHKKGNGGDDGNGGELPLDVTAADQQYVYNGQPQGQVGSSLRVTETNPLATAIGLVQGHRLSHVSIRGDQQTAANTYRDALTPTGVRIVDADGRDVTDKYLLASGSYLPGDLIIHKKGNGRPDGNGGEQPMTVTATDQYFIYNGQPQGTVGRNLTSTADNPLASAVALVPGHRVATITISGTKQKDAGVYPGSLTPSEARIVDGSGRDVTDNYLLTGDSYGTGSLTIRKSDEVYILSVHHVDMDGKTINVPSITVHMAGDTYGYGALTIKDYRAVRASILHGGAVERENAPVSANGLIMPGADVTVVIYYESTGTTPTPSPSASATTGPSTSPTTGPTTRPTTPPTTGTTVRPTATTAPGGVTVPPGGGGGSGGGSGGGTGTGGGTGSGAGSGTGSGSGSSGAGVQLTTIMDNETPLQGYTNRNFGDCVE